MKDRVKFWIVLSVLVGFAAGLLGGILSERYYFHSRRHARMASARRGPEHPPSVERLARELGLSVEQQDKIKKIFEGNDPRLKELRSEMHSRLSEIRLDIKNQIDAVLTPEQKQKLESMIEKSVEKRPIEHDQKKQDYEKERSQDKSKGDVR